MKKKVIFILMLTVVISLFANDFMQPIQKETAEFDGRYQKRVYEGSSRVIPDFSFITEPNIILTSFFDYMPGSYNSFPLRIQPDGNGMYVVFHARETAAANRRVYYAYIDANGNILNVATIETEDVFEGYAGIGIDPVTSDPLVSWHEVYSGPISHRDKFSYDLYHLGAAGLWKTPFTLIDETIPTPFDDDDFIWPYVYVGPSPNADKRRVYVVCNNYISHQPSGNPSENVLIGFADFDENDFNAQSELTWTWNTIPMLDGWNQGIPEEVRPNQAFAVSQDGQVAYMGYSSGISTGDELYVFYNDNYGEGDYEYISMLGEWDIPNPQNQDGTYRFVDPDTGQPQELYMMPYLCNHANAVFSSDNSKLMFLGNMNMMLRPDQWYPDLPMMYLKLYTFDPATEEFDFMDFVDVPGANPNDDNPMLPWDLDEDGEVDEYDPEGYVTWVGGHPIYFDVVDDMFHENQTRLVTSPDNGWMAATWIDGLKNRYAIAGDPNYAGWEEKVEIKIALSANNGVDWSEPITMNAKQDDDNYVSQLDGMMPCYFYPSDTIIDLGNGHGRLDFFFYDDNSFGSYSSPSGHGQNLGGSLMYMSMDLDFSELVTGTDPNLVSVSPISSVQNYPNPFNPTTTIAYSLDQNAEISINVYNPKGQKINTLFEGAQTAGDHTVSWNGKDINNKSVASGVYFYEINMKGTDYTSLRKMLLLK
ncbi:MAG: T9SS type A sorting domain-containing protein [Candidatus Cloacimonetes bacterium]|nr:T9SS type A sorting domain-containing protein [Candidatus Cloacimonadota bacterium]MCF7813587.1 T9SS type A sorting domain-containing protein [Candidatus Cloacimonadota bacterium]MCF7868218.1 T9SS type A sorting domain-containing protein [Candidatus Cloacimonadota bacterium]MCF7883618.1 T9SS type A sorting domain-containing protein [Candidatus Cloacimonadota bacterium]